MAKKIMAVLLALICVLTVSTIPVLADNIAFPDLGETHWAYKFVSVLVNDGTVKGNQNGYFEPNKMVTRAEFVKMIGQGPTRRNIDYSDVPKSHWGYDYVMTSGVNADSKNNFNPSIPMTRGETINILWTRAGKPTGNIAPSMVTNQATNKEAVAWIYSYGVMVGSDGINLRLSDPISRAEAATLIVRARAINQSSTQINFADTVSPKLLEEVYNSVNLFDFPYDPNKTITNGEMAKAALRLASEEYTLTYRKLSVDAPFENKYAKDLAIIGKCIGQDKVNKDFVEQYANNKDTVSAFIYATLLKARQPIGYGNANNFYKDLSAMDKNLANTCLTFGYENGIQIYSKGAINPSERITLKSIATLLLQLDYKVGLQSVITSDVDKNGKNIAYDVKFEKDIGKYSEKLNQFACIIEGLPTDIYTKAFEAMPTLDGSYGKNPRQTYNFAREYGGMFVDLLNQYKDFIKQKHGIDVRFTYIPSLVCDNKNGYTFRIKCEIINVNEKSVAYKDVFTGASTASIEDKLYNGMTFYADVTTDYTMGTGAGGKFGFGKIVYKEK